MRFLYATDLHGNRDAIDQAFQLAHSEQVGAIVFGGDLTPKSVAIKLARYPDPSKENTENEEEISLLGGEVMPTHMIEDKSETHSFTNSLREIKELNERIGSDTLAKYLVRKGSILYEVGSQYFEIESMLMEQVLLDKLYAFFQGAKLSHSRKHLKLSDEEVEMVKYCVVDWLTEFENVLDPEKKVAFVAKCKKLFGYEGEDFSDVAPSRYLLECILFELSGSKIRDIFGGVDEFLKNKKDHIAEHLRQFFHRERDRIFRASNYRGIIEESWIAALSGYSTVAQLKRDVEKPEFVGVEQAKFLREYFFPRVREWNVSHPGRPVYAMLGNDDIIENLSLLDEAEQEGLLCHMRDDRVSMLTDDLNIVGYSFVETLPPKVEYRAWVKSPDQILTGLRSVAFNLRHRKAIWVIHNPPFGYVDQIVGGHAGSQGVLEFLEQFQPPLALFGHIHEAPRLTGKYTAKLGETLCVNPGGEHENGLQAVIINSETLEVERGAK
ncbi:MAG: hypothetical protein KBB77_02665 [Candidatus Moranbacteria bacterium]|nr:hypothetical protein [Candidatus Moranbacteria bacterium]